MSGSKTTPLSGQLQGNEHATTKPSCASVRTFVCQGSGKAAAVLYGSAIKCRCGVWSAAEVLS